MDPCPCVSVIMNCYNSAQYLAEAIDSVYAQTLNDWEIIFFDNCSTDNSADDSPKYMTAACVISVMIKTSP